jgi:hypothetical protein
MRQYHGAGLNSRRYLSLADCQEDRLLKRGYSCGRFLSLHSLQRARQQGLHTGPADGDATCHRRLHDRQVS